MDAWRGEIEEREAYNQGVLSGLDHETAERFARYKIFWKYYRGEHKKHLKPRQFGASQGPDDNVTVNLSRRVVNKGASFLFGEPLEWEVKGANQESVKETLNAIWKSAEWKMSFLGEMAINGGVTGDFYLQVLAPTPVNPLPRVINLNPGIVIPYCDNDDVDMVTEYELRWRSGRHMTRTRYIWADDGLSWDVINEIKTGNIWVSDARNPNEVWNYTWAPIIHGKNLPNPNNFFGVSDLEDADLNDAINGAVSNLNRIVRIFAHPIVWGKMFNQSDLDVSKIALSKDPGAALGALELARDVSGVQGFAQFLSSEFSEVTQVPENDSDRMRIGAQSGFAMRVLFHELVQKTNTKRSSYGSAIVDTCKRLLELAGEGENNEIKLHWKSPLPVDPHEQVESDSFDLAQGLASRETVATRRGYDWKQEQERIKAQNIDTVTQT